MPANSFIKIQSLRHILGASIKKPLPNKDKSMNNIKLTYYSLIKEIFQKRNHQETIKVTITITGNDWFELEHQRITRKVQLRGKR